MADHDFWDELIKNILRIWIVPELNRRQKAGELPDDFQFYAGQVVMEPGAPLEVRLNEEVRGLFFVKEDAKVGPGVEVAVADFATIASEVVNLELEDDDRPNAGHLTMIRNGPGWFVTFDLRYNAARIAEHLAAIDEFLNGAQADLSERRMRGFVNDLFVAAELMAKARLLVHPDERLLGSKKHSFTISAYNLFARQGNTDKRFASLLNRLSKLRNAARFPDGPFHLSEAEATEMLSTAQEMRDRLIGEVPRRALARVTKR